MARYMPTESDLIIGSEALIGSYLTGVNLLNYPEGMSDYHRRDVGDTEDALDIVIKAEDLMYKGCQLLIALTYPPNNAKGSVERRLPRGEHGAETAYTHFDNGFLPALEMILEAAYSRKHDRIAGLNKDFATSRPIPLYDKTLVDNICHSRKGKITTTEMMGGVIVARSLEHIVTPTRNLADGRKIGDTALRLVSG